MSSDVKLDGDNVIIEGILKVDNLKAVDSNPKVPIHIQSDIVVESDPGTPYHDRNYLIINGETIKISTYRVIMGPSPNQRKVIKEVLDLVEEIRKLRTELNELKRRIDNP